VPAVGFAALALLLAWLGNVALFQLEEPSGYPRLERALIERLLAQLDALEPASALAGIVVTGTPQAFAAGASLEEVSALSPLEAVRFSKLGQALMRRIEQYSKPVVAAIRGYCLGGGFDLALACHARIAAESAVFAHPGGSLGIITGWGGTQRLARITGRARCLEILTTGGTLTAAKALASRLVSQVVPSESAVNAAVAFLKIAAAKKRQ
jgi:enoyl-CoA hydratase